MCSSPGAADSCGEEDGKNEKRGEGRNARETPWQYCRNSRRLISLRFFRDRLSEIPPVFYCAKAKSSIGVEARQVCRSAVSGPLAAQSRTPRSAMIAVSLIAYHKEDVATLGSLANKSSFTPGAPSDHHVVRPTANQHQSSPKSAVNPWSEATLPRQHLLPGIRLSERRKGPGRREMAEGSGKAKPGRLARGIPTGTAVQERRPRRRNPAGVFAN
jgi:hypothetical protein